MELKTAAPVREIALGNGLGQSEPVPADGEWPEVVTFPWFGTPIRVNPGITDTALVDLIEESGEMDDKDPRAGIVLKAFIRTTIHPDDFDEFWRVGKAHNYTLVQFAETAARIIEAVTGDPTQPPNDSSPGPSEIAGKSTAASYKRVREDLEGEGRPDLAEFYWLAEQAQVVR
jgi:hypothetical protein